MQTNLFFQFFTKDMHAQGLHRLASETRDGARHVIHMLVNQRDFSGFTVITKQLQVNIRVFGRRTMPHCATKVGPKRTEPLHPDQGKSTQRPQFLRLGVGTKYRDVAHHRILQHVIGRQRGTPAQPQLAGRTPLGGAVLQPIFYHPTGGQCSNFGGYVGHKCCILP